MDRRDFLKGAALVGGAAVVGGLAGCTQSGTAATKWDEEYDIVIVGGGGAAHIAGITTASADPNAKVVLFEKMSAPGGSTIMSGGNIGAMGTKNLLDYAAETKDPIYKDDTFESYYEDKLTAGCYLSDPKIAHLFCFNSLDNFNWLESLGIKWKGSRLYESPIQEPSDWRKSAEMQACQYLRTYNDQGKSTTVNKKVRYNIGSTYKDKSGGAGNFLCLQDTLKKYSNAKVVVDAPVKTIVRANQISGDVQGVILENGKRIKAKRAVILASGGYAANGKMCNMYDPRIPATVGCSGGLGNTGDMLTAASLIGGQLVNMNCIQVDFGASVKEATMSGTADSNPFGSAADYIDVKKDGNRFWTEKPKAEDYMDAENTTMREFNMTSWFRLGDSQSVTKATAANLAAFAKTFGKVCNTVKEVADFIGCPEATLQANLDRYNKYVGTKVDLDFGKPKTMLTHTINKPPYYVTELTFYTRTTPGGLRIDTNSQVLDVNGAPIPRLFAAGEVTGNVHGRFRNNGGDSWTDMTCFGRIAGNSAIKLAPQA
ncbi:MAG: FAD-binding protein [Coriobacteriia bacterium]|nr:FAD-binding protein [Coriobacteriia bacterium]